MQSTEATTQANQQLRAEFKAQVLFLGCTAARCQSINTTSIIFSRIVETAAISSTEATAQAYQQLRAELKAEVLPLSRKVHRAICCCPGIQLGGAYLYELHMKATAAAGQNVVRTLSRLELCKGATPAGRHSTAWWIA
jgi:hypothetical protein